MADAFHERLTALVSRITLGMECVVDINRDEENTPGRLYLQIACWRRDIITGEMGIGYGGKGWLSQHMTDSEIFQVAFGLYRAYWEHEARETFEIDGLRPFGPHIKTEALMSISRQVDVRSARHVEDRV
jgi:hypothetical protein